MQRYAAAKAGGTDGRDHGYRMVIEDKYRKLAGLRKTIRASVLAQIVLAALFAADQLLAGAGLFAGLALLLAGASTAAVLLGFGAKERLVLLQAARSLSGFVVLLCAWDVFNSAAHGGSVFGAGNALLKVPGLSAHASLSLSKGLTTVLRIALGSTALVSSNRIASFIKARHTPKAS